MRPTALLACLTLLALAFAGCSGKDKDGGASSSSSSSHTASTTVSSTSHSSTSTTSSTSTSTGTSAANHAPTGSVSVSVNGTDATFTLSGSDQDQDTLVWNLTFGDGAKSNGTTLPANVTHAYAAGGNFSANFTLTDGKDAAAYNVTVAITAGGSDGGVGQAVAGSWQVSGFACPDLPPAVPMFGTPADGVLWLEFDVEAATIGLPYFATATAANPLAFFFQVGFYDSGGMMVGEIGTGLAGPASGTVPAGAVHGLVADCAGGAMMEVQYASGSLVPPA